MVAGRSGQMCISLGKSGCRLGKVREGREEGWL